MKNNKDIFEYAQYYEILCRLIYDFKVFSQTKVILLAFSIYNQEYSFESSKKEYGLFDDVLIGIKFGLQKNMNQFETIFNCLSLLKKTNMVSEKNEIISIKSVPNYSHENTILSSPQMKRAIEEIEKLSNESIIKGVIEYV